MKDFFVSHSGKDTEWAEWIAWVLEEAKHSVVLDAWDFGAGSNFVLEMDKATEADRTIAVLTQSYIDGLYTKPEWAAAFAADPKGDERKLLPVRVEECELKGLLKSIVYIDLVGLDEDTARRRLLDGVKRGRAKPTSKPGLPPTQRAVPTRPHFPGSRTLPPHWNVPYQQNLNFTGRADLLERIRDEMTQGHRAALTQHQAITGLGGIGKTQLALEYAYRRCGEYQIVWWVGAEEAAQLTGDFCRLAHSLGLPEKEQTDQRVVAEAVRRWLEGNGGWLLIFDNVPDRAALKDCLPQGGDGHVLITSRAQQWGGVAQRLPVPVWPRDESIAFLRTRTGREEEENDTLGELAEELGDLPLALEQAAAYMSESGISIDDYLKLYRERREELWQDEKAPDEYPETVATTWDMAFEAARKEEPAAADLLNLCAFLASDDIPRNLLAKVIEDPLVLNRAIAALGNYSLITTEDDSLSLHRLVQAVTRDRLSEKERKRWAGVAVRLLDAAFPFKDDDPATWDESGRLLPHALAAGEHAVDAGVGGIQPPRVLSDAGTYLWRRAAFTQARDVFQGTVTAAERIFGEDDSRVASCVNNLGAVLRAMGDLKGAKAHFERALTIHEKAGGPDHPDVATLVNNLGNVLREMGDLEGAKNHFERALSIFEKTYGEQHPQVATAANNLGTVFFQQGNYEEARRCQQRALDIDEKIYGPEHPSAANRVTNLGDIFAATGDTGKAREYYERALAIFVKFFGEEHPDTQRVRRNLEALGEK